MNYDNYFKGNNGEEFYHDCGSASIAMEIARHVVDGRLLEVGAGLHQIFPGSDTFDIVAGGTYTGSIDSTGILPANTYSTIIMSHVIEHVESDYMAVRNCRDALIPGGVLVCVSPFGEYCTEKEYNRNGHLRRYNLHRVERLELPDFPCVYYRNIHWFYNIVWNRLKYIFKAINYPFRSVPYYRRWWFNRDRLISLMNIVDRRFEVNAGNALFVFKKK
jgi:SAM-dependent methyltransferase